jgi:outer membrane murein-binding lipoprotein Lpp
VTQVKKVADLIAEISAASQEQSQGIEQVNKAVTTMDSVTQQNAAQTEELSSTAQALAAQAEELTAQVGQFRLGEEAASREPRAASLDQQAAGSGQLAGASVKPTAKVIPLKQAAAPPPVRVATGTDDVQGEFEEF